MTKQILVVGAGASGLAAARALAQARCKVTVLEARERLGGRIYTRHHHGAGAPVELGAEFVHGRHPELWRMASAAEMLLYEIQGEHRYARQGRLRADASIWDKTEEIFSRMRQAGGPDRTFKDFVSKEFPGAEWEEARAWAIAYVEGFNAADHERVSLQWLIASERASDGIDGDRQFRPAAGYALLIDWLADDCAARGVTILRNTVVHQIEWEHGRVSVQAQNAGSAAVFDAESVIITAPLGTLQASSIHFQPAIEAKLQAARELSVGSAMRVTLVCKEPFWEAQLPSAAGENLAKLSFMHARTEQFPTWWTSYPLQAKTITAWAGGPKAASIAALDTADHISVALDSLAHATGLSRDALERLVEDVYHHDWQKDPFARGAYSYVPAGAMDAIERLADPWDDTLFFAGEATDTSGHTGTVHGAIASGLRAADQVIARLAPLAGP